MKRIHQLPYSQSREASKYKGVAFDEANNKWVARFEGEHLGYFDEELQAAKAIKQITK